MFTQETTIEGTQTSTSKRGTRTGSKLTAFSRADVNDIKETVSTARELRHELAKMKEEAEKMRNLIFLGFLVMILMVIGLFFTFAALVLNYWEFTQREATVAPSAESSTTIQMQLLEQEIRILKSCLKAGSWAGCF